MFRLQQEVFEGIKCIALLFDRIYCSETREVIDKGNEVSKTFTSCGLDFTNIQEDTSSTSLEQVKVSFGMGDQVCPAASHSLQ